VIGPTTTDPASFVTPQALPILAIGVLQLGLWFQQRASWRALVGCGCLAASVTLAASGFWNVSNTLQGIIAFHVGLAVVLLVGALCDDPLGRLLRNLGAALVVLAGLAAVIGPPRHPAGLPPEFVNAYPLLLAMVASLYATLSGYRLFLRAACACLAAWMVGRAGEGYSAVRRIVVGLDEIALGLAFFVLATLISLGKAGLLAKWLAKRKNTKLATSSDEFMRP
jgi:hypothetical protein